MSEKRYGLIVPKKGGQIGQNLLASNKKRSVFQDSGDELETSEEESGPSDWVATQVKSKTERSIQSNQARQAASRALEEDPTVFQYDEVYDNMERQKEERKSTKAVDRKPRYITNLLKTAEKRKLEYERRTERKVQKERETEGERYNDKESYVTSAYKAKLEEFQKAEEEEKRKDQIEAMLDVTKQKDLSGFYRHLYNQTMEPSAEVKSEEIKAVKGTKVRSYRQRADSSSNSSSRSPPPVIKKEKSSDEAKHTELNALPESPRRLETSAALLAAVEAEKNACIKIKTDDLVSNESTDSEEEQTETEKPKVDVWKKRTTGEVFEEARKRYLQRKGFLRETDSAAVA
uniref:EOG090X0D2W n=1 Tax=Lynceus sp. MCZ IZ 141354 TaxID=1930659 RepID=A0A9N6WTE5_9CRUS|nr:EOG090X0D2W [Lynceus sp. MCZ IZ 141354]